MRRRHAMPFGAEVLADGGVRFRIWAPAAESVDLCLEDADKSLPMRGETSGWFVLETNRAAAGSRYRFRINKDLHVPDPASRFQAQDVHGPSEVIDPRAWRWRDGDWKGHPWEQAVIYECHVGSFTRQGTYRGVTERLDYLRDLGVTALELMPIADFPGGRNWGYDGVLPFAPDSRYGRPDDLKSLVDAAHAKGLMVFLDVVYNHFGPEGNYLHGYAPSFFSQRHHTPWGAAINFDGQDCRTVRDFFIHNALYWLEEYRFDGLRLDAVHAIMDDSSPDILEELADEVNAGPGRERQIHLVLENDHNATRYLRHDRYRAQWNEDLHHVLHVLTTGEISGYYADYQNDPLRHLARCLTEGFSYQGEVSAYRQGANRGESTRDIPLTAFVSFLQNHDQIGNRPLGDRLVTQVSPEALRAVTAIILLAPSPPLLFMGQEWGSEQPFLFFCDFEPDLAAVVTEGRRRDFARFPEFSDPRIRETLPDPNAVETFRRSTLDWTWPSSPVHADWFAFHRDLLHLRNAVIVPRLNGMTPGCAHSERLGEQVMRVSWELGDGSRLVLIANLGTQPAALADIPAGETLYPQAGVGDQNGELGPWEVIWLLAP